MVSGFENQEGGVVLGKLKAQLALAVRSIQWSYAIFWSISDRQPGVLGWEVGYYNGDIKTRKTVQSVEFNADQLGLQRSEQLRELYESLSAGEASPQQCRRPSASLSPEDLTDTEWYFLVCMSFVFNIGQGLPGKTLATGQPIWLCNAHCADGKLFSRSLLAKSASIQTVVCFPYLRGVVELGVTDLVAEDPSLIQHIKTSFLETSHPIESNASAFDDKMDAEFIQVIGSQGLDVVASPNDSSDYEPVEDSFMVEATNGDFMDDYFSNCIHPSVNSSDRISQTIVKPIKVAASSEEENAETHRAHDFQECNTKLAAVDLQSDDLHYHGVLSSLLKTSHPLILGPNFQRSSLHESSFIGWTKQGSMNSQKPYQGAQQRLLKKLLFDVPRMHVDGLVETPEDDGNKIGALMPDADEMESTHVLQERKRREKLNERFTILKSIVPSVRKVDKISILDDTIEYVRGLERRVGELESIRESKESETRTKGKLQDTAERTSDNYGSNRIGTRAQTKASANKRKASDVENSDAGFNHQYASRDSLVQDIVTVCVNKKDVVIEISCPWREGILLEFMDAISHLSLDSHSVQSSNTNGTLSLTIKSKQKGFDATSAGKIKQTLERVALKS